MPLWFCLLLILLGVGLMAWLGMRVLEIGVHSDLLRPIEPVILAGIGALLTVFALFKLVFGRGIKPPERHHWRDRKEPVGPAVPKGMHFASIASKPAAPPLPESSASPTARSFVRTEEGSFESTRHAATPPPSLGSAPMPSNAVLAVLRDGAVIPAHPLALNSHREFDAHHTQVLSRYYLASGVQGLAVGVHTTQFGIRKPKHNLLRPVLELVAQEMVAHENRTHTTLIKVAGICGNTQQAVTEAQLAKELGYDIGLLNLASVPLDATDYELIQHCREVAKVMPVFGFYLSPSLGGRPLPYRFWRAFAEISNVVAIKVATFNRYQALDVMRAVAESGRALTTHDGGSDNPIAMYTGNDDTIVEDLVGEWQFDVNGSTISQRIVGGLLGHWACWTRAAVDTFRALKNLSGNGSIPTDAALLARQVTDMNGAIFDAANNFRGAIPGVLEVLHRQGLIDSNLCLDPAESLSPGQAEEITRVCNAYPHLIDDAFVHDHLSEWKK